MENNILIAEFLEFTYEQNLGWYDNAMVMPQYVYDRHKGNCFEELLFDESWDWLIVAVDKCFSVTEDGDMIDIMHNLQVANKKATYYAVVEFINVYNQKKK